ncbi:pyridoxal phosphate-dependent aminotransferase [Granulicella arctica]|uniref:pyridoxal phosphate-dependent aminotransferase n=1 Tax=Granulicella arctica TaxID=940613 RepID=UPI0021E04446|nr:aminotransferase class I/II-fold pyridoxal phosphate-dependent enzyme [Granulicella arctica]
MTPLPSHGGQLRGLSAQFGVAATELLDFSANINPDGPPLSVLSSLRVALEDVSVLTNYPDLDHTDLKLSIAKNIAVQPGQISIANGFVPLLDAALKALLIRHCLLPVPAFNEYRIALERAQMRVTPCHLSSQHGFIYEIEKLTTGDHDAILLANPQNPSGVLCNLVSIVALVAQAEQRGMYVLLDEAFIDYEPAQSAAAYIDRFPNLIIFRSVTKFHAIPGLRVAYAIASSEKSAALQANLPPWPITNLAAVAVIAALADETYPAHTRRLNEQRRQVLEISLNELGVITYPSSANFLLLRLPQEINELTFWQRMLIEHHIVLRSCRDYEALSPGHLRVAVRTSEQNSLLVGAIATLLSSMG